MSTFIRHKGRTHKQIQ